MSDESVIKRKLMFDGDGTGEEKKINAFLKLVPKFILSDDTSNAEATYNTLIAQLESIVTDRKKRELTQKSSVKEMEMYNNLQTTYQEKIYAIKEDIEKQKELLQKAKIVKQNQVERDLLVKIVTKEPSRGITRKKIESLQNELNNLQKEKQNLGKKLNSRVKQCCVLSTSANTLKGILDDEKVGENLMDVSSTKSENSEQDMQVTLSK